MDFNVKTVKLEIYMPVEYLVNMRDALNSIGACRVGNYDHVISYEETKGYWRPLDGSNPFDGEKGVISFGTEVKLEARCPIELVNKAIMVIKEIHPYETPTINVIPLLEDWE